MSEPFRYDWPAALERIIESGEEPDSFCIYCLPKAGVLMLIALMERLRWRATFRVDDYDYSDWTELQNIVDDTEIGLMNCEDIINQITTTITNSVTTTIISQVVSNEGVCCFLDDQPVNDPPPIPDFPQPGEERAAICKQAQKAHDNGRAFLVEVFTYGEAGAGISAGVIGALLATYVMALPLALLVSLVGLIVFAIVDFLTDDILSDWDALKEEIVCAIYSSSTAGEAWGNVQNVIEESTAGETAKTLFKTLYNQGQVNNIFAGNVGSTAGYSADYCSGCEGGIPWQLTFTFDEGLEGWVPSNMGWDDEGMRITADVSGSGSPVHASIGYTNIRTALGLPGGTSFSITFCQADLVPYGNLTSATAFTMVRATGADVCQDSFICLPGIVKTAQISCPAVFNGGNPNTLQINIAKNGGSSPQVIGIDNVILSGTYLP